MFFDRFFLKCCIAFLLALMVVSCSPEPEPVKKKARQHFINVDTARLEKVTLKQSRISTLQPVKDIKIYTQQSGKITEYPFFEGDAVSANDIVARLDSRLIKAELRKAESLRQKAQQDLSRIRRLSRNNMTSQTELNRAETDLAVARADELVLSTRLGRYTIKSPIDGVVSHRSFELGTVVEDHTHLLTISDNRQLRVKVPVPESFISYVSLGQEVDISIKSALPPNNTAKGMVSRIHPNLDASSRSGLVEVLIKDIPEGARPGQTVQLTFTSTEEERLMVPFIALRQSSKGEYVYIYDKKKTRVKKIKVVSGVHVDNKVEILEGLKPDQQVVIKGFTNLRHKKKVVLVSDKKEQ